MQWVEVAQAELIEKLRPLILNQVASVAEGPELIALGTANGPTRLGPRLRAVSAASTIERVEAPPEPTIRPGRRKPSSAYSGAATTPERASRSEARTSLALLPIEDTTPIPVTTTRRMF